MTATRQDRLATVALYLIASAPPETDPDTAWLERVAAAVEGGVGAVQLRQKGVDTETRRRWLSRLRESLGKRVLLLVNDDLAAVRQGDGALLADGLHLGRADAQALGGAGTSAASRRREGLSRARRSLGPALLLGSSTRSAAEITLALASGADHVGFGAMTVSSTKPGARPARPEDLCQCLARFPTLPLFPIGGVDQHTLPHWLALGSTRAAVGRALLEADDPRAVAETLMSLLTGGDPRPPTQGSGDVARSPPRPG